MNVIDDKRRTGRTTEMIRAAVDDTFHERNVIVIMSSKRECDHWRQVISVSATAVVPPRNCFTAPLLTLKSGKKAPNAERAAALMQQHLEAGREAASVT